MKHLFFPIMLLTVAGSLYGMEEKAQEKDWLLQETQNQQVSLLRLKIERFKSDKFKNDIRLYCRNKYADKDGLVLAIVDRVTEILGNYDDENELGNYDIEKNEAIKTIWVNDLFDVEDGFHKAKNEYCAIARQVKAALDVIRDRKEAQYSEQYKKRIEAANSDSSSDSD
jgi:hypothetical protein